MAWWVVIPAAGADLGVRACRGPRGGLRTRPHPGLWRRADRCL